MDRSPWWMAAWQYQQVVADRRFTRSHAGQLNPDCRMFSRSADERQYGQAPQDSGSGCSWWGQPDVAQYLTSNGLGLLTGKTGIPDIRLPRKFSVSITKRAFRFRSDGNSRNLHEAALNVAFV